MQYEDSNFFYAIQLDNLDMITNIFWCDAKMRADFVNFGDVVCFDTTYGKNNEGRPIALFVGVNHHKQSIIFGAALLYDETTESFEWLFDTFSLAMSGSKPKTILTDQDPGMAKALASKWPETNHRLCIWHIYQNAAIHLSSVFSEFNSFTEDFKKCIYDYEEEDDFLKEWNSMLDKYDLNDNVWLKRLFEIRKKWSLVYGRQVFCGDMTTTQRSESMNMLLKRYVSYKNKFLEFFHFFERLIEHRRYDELVAEFKANSTVPSLKYSCELNKHASTVYTPEVFYLFEKEFKISMDTSCEECERYGDVRVYKVTPRRKRYHHTVTHDVGKETFDCSCKKFQFAGILCSHVLKVFSMKGVYRIPDQYILKRWTRKAKIGHTVAEDTVLGGSNLDPKVLYRLRYKDLCHLYVQLATKAAETEDTYMTARNRLLETLDIVDAGLQSWGKSDKPSSSLVTSSAKEQLVEINSESGNKIKGIKRKAKPSSSKRLKCPLEEAVRKRKSCRQNVKKKKSCEKDALMSQQRPQEDSIHYTCPEVQKSNLHVSASDMVNPSSFQSYLSSQSSQVHGAASDSILVNVVPKIPHFGSGSFSGMASSFGLAGCGQVREVGFCPSTSIKAVGSQEDCLVSEKGSFGGSPNGRQKSKAPESNSSFNTKKVHGVANFGTSEVSVLQLDRWKPPEAGFLKANFGAYAFQDRGIGGVGVVMRDDKGIFVAAMAAKVPLYATYEELEAEALRMLVKWLLGLRLDRIIIEGDAFNVLMQLSDPRDIRAGYAIMVDQARGLLSGIREWKSSWTSRTTNLVADELAKNVGCLSEDMVYYRSPPDVIKIALLAGF